MPNRERLFLLDGMALAYRAYFAFISRPLINSKGMNTSAIYGFTTTLMRLLEDEKPEHIAVVFDTREPTFRHKMYEPYKATREKMPEDMSSQLGLLKDVVRAFNVPVVEVPGFEADDVIGTLAKRAENENVLTYMVTGDKDFMQLITPLIKILRPGKGGDDPEVVDEQHVLEKFGVDPPQVVDVLALIGDKSDNVPGVPGIGEKTAIPLIKQYGNLDNLLEHADAIPQKGLREKLLNNKELALLSRQLVTIQTDVPVPIDFHQLKANTPDNATLLRYFQELEFKSLANKLSGAVHATIETTLKQAPEPERTIVAPADIQSTTHRYKAILSSKDLDALVKKLNASRTITFDTETTDRDPLRAELVGIAFAVEPGEAFYIPVQAQDKPSGDMGDLFGNSGSEGDAANHTADALALQTVIKKLSPILENPSIEKVGQNLKYDMLVMAAHGVSLRGIAFDTMVASYIIRPDAQHNLESLAFEHLNYKMVSFEDLVGKGRSRKHITEVTLDAITGYACEDADITLQVAALQEEKLRELEQLELCEKLEFPLIAVLGRMEDAGITLDTGYLSAMSNELEQQIENLVKEIHADAGGPFNINSTQQLGDILFNRLKLPIVRKTKTGYSTDVNVLETLKGQHPIIERMLDYRQYTKLKSTYIDALPQLVNPKTGRLHTSFNQTVALTGRLSSADPNLQNIPIRTELGRAIRKAFIPGEEGNVIMSADYSQIELRVMAHVSGDEGLLEAFRNNEDIHASTSAKVFGVPIGEVTRDMRRKAKEVNFGIMYGIGPFGLASRLEISQTEAKEIINRYFERFPKVKQYINDTMDSARRKGYVSTLLGRRRYLPDINSRNFTVRSNAERQAINMPIQGTAADMIKLAMIGIDSELFAGPGRRKSSLRTKMLLQVHDELVFEVPETELEAMKQLVVDKMQNAMTLNVPIAVEVGAGRNWLEAH